MNVSSMPPTNTIRYFVMPKECPIILLFTPVCSNYKLAYKTSPLASLLHFSPGLDGGCFISFFPPPYRPCSEFTPATKVVVPPRLFSQLFYKTSKLYKNLVSCRWL